MAEPSEIAAFALMKNASAPRPAKSPSAGILASSQEALSPTPFLGEAGCCSEDQHVLRPGRIQSILHPSVKNSFVAVVGQNPAGKVVDSWQLHLCDAGEEGMGLHAGDASGKWPMILSKNIRLLGAEHLH